MATVVAMTANADLVVNGDFSSGFAGARNWADWGAQDDGWYHSTWSHTDGVASMGLQGLGQINTVTDETGDILALSFDWAPDASATGDQVRLHYNLAGWINVSTNVGAGDDFMRFNATGNASISGLSGKATLVDLLNGAAYPAANNRTLTRGYVTGTAGVTNHYTVHVVLTPYAANRDDVSDLTFFGIRFHGISSNVGGTLDNVSVVPSKAGGNVDLSASVSLEDGNPGKAWRSVNYALPNTLNDWALFNGTSLTNPVQTRAGGNILGNFVAGGATLKDAGGDSLMFSWTNGTPTATSGGADMGVGTVASTDYTGPFLTWDVTLPPASAAVESYEMQYYTVDKRLNTSLQVSNAVMGAFIDLASTTGNTENFLRLWTVTIDGDYAGSPTLTFRYNIDSTIGGVDYVMGFGGITVSSEVVDLGCVFVIH